MLSLGQTRLFGRLSGASAFKSKSIKSFKPPSSPLLVTKKQKVANLHPHSEPGAHKSDRVKLRKAFEAVLLSRFPDNLSLAMDPTSSSIIQNLDDDVIDRNHYNSDGVHYFDVDAERFKNVFLDLVDDSRPTPSQLVGLRSTSFRHQKLLSKEAKLRATDDQLRNFESTISKELAGYLATANNSSTVVIPDHIDVKLVNLVRRLVFNKKEEIREKIAANALLLSSPSPSVSSSSSSPASLELESELNKFTHPSNLLNYLISTIKIPSISSIPPKTFTAVIQHSPNSSTAMKLVDELVAPASNHNKDGILTSRLSSVLVSLAIKNNNNNNKNNSKPDIDSALTILRSLQHKYPSARPSVEAYTTLIWACASIAKNNVGGYSSKDMSSAAELGWTLWKELKVNNVTLDEGAYQAIICLLSQVGLVERCVNLLDEMGSVRFDQANKLPYDVRVGLSNDDEVYKYDDPTLYRRQAYKDTIRAIARSANISTRFRGLGKNNRRTKKEFGYLARILDKVVDIAKTDVDLSEGGGLMADSRIYAALAAVCGAVGDGQGAVACFRARDAFVAEKLNLAGEKHVADSKEFEKLKHTTTLASFSRSISNLGTTWVGFENAGFLDATTVDLIDRGASESANPAGYKPVDNTTIDGLSNIDGAIANMEWDDFDDDHKSVKGKKFMGIKVNELSKEELQFDDKVARDTALQAKIDEARLLMYEERENKEVEAGRERERSNMNVDESGYGEDKLVRQFLSEMEGEGGGEGEETKVDFIDAGSNSSSVAVLDSDTSSTTYNSMIENKIAKLKDSNLTNLVSELPALDFITALRDPIPDDFNRHDVQRMYLKKADEVFETAVREDSFNVEVLNSKLGVLTAAGKVRDSLAFFYEKYSELEVQRNGRSVRVLMEGLTKNKRIEEAVALKCFVERDMGQNIDNISYGHLIRVLANRGETGSALLLVKECKDRNGGIPAQFFLKTLQNCIRKREEVNRERERSAQKRNKLLGMVEVEMELVPKDPAAWAKLGLGEKGMRHKGKSWNTPKEIRNLVLKGN